MINLTVSNNKLFHRSVKIVASVTGKDEDTCKECLLKAVNGVDTLTHELLALPLSVHIERATPQANIVPTAVLVAAGGITVAKAVEMLERSDERTTLRDLVAQVSV
jgi:N-acetylmuramic acid 6-phosphate (MurNAc-6-P) etherase